jgi:hypothetical protein
MSPRSLGLVLIVVGIGLSVLGLVVWTGALGWFGRLPGDIRIESETTRVYIPVTSMLIASAVLSLVVWALRKLL